MSIGYLLSESYAGRYYKIKVPGDYFKNGVDVMVGRHYDGTYTFEPLLADIYINPHDPSLELLEEYPEEAHLFHCPRCRHYSMSICDEDDDPSLCNECINRSAELDRFAIDDAVYRFKTNTELHIILTHIDGITHHTDEIDDEYKKAEKGLVIIDTHLDDFDDYPLTWYRIIPKPLMDF